MRKLSVFLLLQYYEMSYGLNVEMHKQVRKDTDGRMKPLLQFLQSDLRSKSQVSPLPTNFPSFPILLRPQTDISETDGGRGGGEMGETSFRATQKKCIGKIWEGGAFPELRGILNTSLLY